LLEDGRDEVAVPHAGAAAWKGDVARGAGRGGRAEPCLRGREARLEMNAGVVRARADGAALRGIEIPEPAENDREVALTPQEAAPRRLQIRPVRGGGEHPLPLGPERVDPLDHEVARR